jgi:hypothetical protein
MLLSAVEESLSTLGDSPKQAILYHLESHFNIKKDTIPTNLTEFAKALERIFGPGADYLEKLITKRLSEKLDIQCECEDPVNFIECVDNLKRIVKGDRATT